MTNEQAISIMTIQRPRTGTKEKLEAYDMAIKALEQESILDKIRAEIQKLRGCSCSCSDGIIDDVEAILDKYEAESEETDADSD
jgi:hypothetical protein